MTEQLVACDECGRLHHYRPLQEGQTAVCQRCGAVLYRQRRNMLEMMLALTLTGLTLYLLTNAFPLLGLRAQGMQQELTLWGACVAFWKQEYYLLSLLMSLNLVIMPLLELCSMLWIALTIRFCWPPALALTLYRWIRVLKPWAMLEVFMLGVLVAVVKLGDLAFLIVGPAFWSFSFLIVVMAAAAAVPDPHTVWTRLEACRHHA
ncbi:MAG: paraquat-inducible protein A [Thiothrix sp.]|nr:paraquat-inducible protein A [Thiothrix sp.]